MSDIKVFKRIPIKEPFLDEKEQSKAYKELFSSPLGQKVLDSFMFDVDYHRPDLPKGADVNAQLAFNAGKRYLVNHILTALSTQYEGSEEVDYYGLMENDNGARSSNGSND